MTTAGCAVSQVRHRGGINPASSASNQAQSRRSSASGPRLGACPRVSLWFWCMIVRVMPVYLDCAATTPMDPRVRAEMLRYLDEDVGNAGSRTHEFGLRARTAVERARDQVAAVVACARGDVIFTSGATESNNLAILGLAAAGDR